LGFEQPVPGLQVQLGSSVNYIHTSLKSALISTGSLVLPLNRTTATLPFDKGRDQTSNPFSLDYNTGIDLKQNW